MDNTELTSIAQRICADYGYTDIEAEFLSLPCLRCALSHPDGRAVLFVSDSLADAPFGIVVDVLIVFMESTKGQTAEYFDRTKEYLTSAEFTERNRPLEMKRHGLTEDVGGKTDLAALAARYADGMTVGWTSRCEVQSDRLLRYILIPEILDGRDEAIAAMLLYEATVLRHSDPIGPFENSAKIKAQRKAWTALNEAGLLDASDLGFSVLNGYHEKLTRDRFDKIWDDCREDDYCGDRDDDEDDY